MQGLRARTAAAASAGAGAGPPPNPRDRHRPCAVGPRAAPPPTPPHSQLGGSSFPPQVAASGDGEMAAVGGPVLSRSRVLARALPRLQCNPLRSRAMVSHRWAAPPASDWDLQLSYQEAKLFKVTRAVSRSCERSIKPRSKARTVLSVALTGYMCSAVTIPHTTPRR